MINYKILRNFVFKIYAYVIRSIIKKALSNKGLHILCISQKFGNSTNQLIDNNYLASNDDTGSYFRYKTGDTLTIVAYGFSIYETMQMIKIKKYQKFDLFVITNPANTNIKKIITSASKSKKVILMDDSGSKNKNLFWLESKLLHLKIKIKRNLNDDIVDNLFLYGICIYMLYTFTTVLN